MALLLARNASAGSTEPLAADWPSGRVPQLSVGNELLVVPRLLLAPPRLVVRALGWPIRELLEVNERYKIDKKFVDATTSTDGLVGVRLEFEFALDFRPLVGLEFFNERIRGKGTLLSVKAETGGLGLVVGDVVFRPIATTHAVSVETELSYLRRDDQLFHGIRTLDASLPNQHDSRYAIDAADLAVRPRLHRGPVTAIFSAQLGLRRFGEGHGDEHYPPIDQVYCVQRLGRCVLGTVDEQLVPGFAHGTQFVRAGGLLRVNTFDRPGKPSAGVLAEFAGYYSNAFLPTPGEASNYIDAWAGLGTAIDLRHHTHILYLHVQAEELFPLDDGQVTFSELPTLGGPDSLRGFARGRFRDYTSAIVSAEYRWPVWMWADAALFVDAGEVAGRHFSHFDGGDIHPDIGVALRVRTSKKLIMRMQVAYGWRDGWQFFLSFGAGVGNGTPSSVQSGGGT